jgi:tetratricopeptide (TPR) repeat protein
MCRRCVVLAPSSSATCQWAKAASIYSVNGRSAEALILVDGVLAQGPHQTPLQARALEVRAMALSNQDRALEAMDAVDKALALPQLDLAQQGRLLGGAFYARYLRGESQQALAYARRSLDVWQRLGNRGWVAKIRSNIGTLLADAGDHDGALVELEAAHAVASELRLVAHQREALMTMLCIASYRGQSTQALALCERYLGLSAAPPDPRHGSCLISFRSCAHYQLGQLGTALQDAEEAHAMALVSGESMCVADSVSMTLDLYTWIGDRAGAAHLLASLQGLPLEGSKYYTVKLAFNRILHALQIGDTAQARQLVDSLGDTQALEQPLDRANAALCEAEVLCAEGQPQAALARLQAWPQPIDHAEIWGRICTLRLTIHNTRAHIDSGVLAQADAALASGHTPALVALQLLRQRQRAAALGGDEPRAHECAQVLAAQVRALAASLQGRAQQRQDFLARWA